MSESKIGLGGGCHWCTEGVFQSLKGVVNVEQGWISSEGDNSPFSEAVIVHFDAKVITLETLISIHLLTHSSDSNHSLRKKYRSAVYVFSEKQAKESMFLLEKLKKELNKPFITVILPFVNFKTNEEQYLNYFYKKPNNTFCKRYVHPKLSMLQKQFSESIDENKLSQVSVIG